MTPSGRELGVCPYFLSQGVGGGGPAGQHGGPPGSRRCPRRGSHSCHLQDQDRHLRDTSEPGGPHVGQLPDLAAVRGGQTLHRLLQHQQCQVPAVTRAPPQRQGEAREGVSVLWEPGEAACRGPGYLRPELGLILPPWGLGPLGTESADSTRDCPRCAGDRPGARGQLPLSRRLLEVVFLPAHLAARGEERPGDPRGGRTLRSALPDRPVLWAGPSLWPGVPSALHFCFLWPPDDATVELSPCWDPGWAWWGRPSASCARPCPGPGWASCPGGSVRALGVSGQPGERRVGSWLPP